MFNKSKYVGPERKLAERKMMQTQKVSGEGSNRKLTVQVKQQIAKRNVTKDSVKATAGS
tara:strand:- start:1522 stop:1698 length:177 start_codon:yes stop_codon:yes gene_type:complete